MRFKMLVLDMLFIFSLLLINSITSGYEMMIEAEMAKSQRRRRRQHS